MQPRVLGLRLEPLAPLSCRVLPELREPQALSSQVLPELLEPQALSCQVLPEPLEPQVLSYRALPELLVVQVRLEPLALQAGQGRLEPLALQAGQERRVLVAVLERLALHLRLFGQPLLLEPQ